MSLAGKQRTHVMAGIKLFAARPHPPGHGQDSLAYAGSTFAKSQNAIMESKTK